MITIKFEVNGRKVEPGSLQDAVMAAALKKIRANLSDRLGAIRDPDTGEYPTVVVRGDNLDNLKIHVEGSPKLLEFVNDRLGAGACSEEGISLSTENPRVFLSYTSDDSELAERLAHALESNGIETWWDKWCITGGDSLRQKIDEGISTCTHFLVLLTPRSINKPWVNQEMDAGLVRKLNDQCRFLPVRSELPASSLPPLLSGLHSPEVGADEDITQLINDIYGVSRRPQRGHPPTVVEQTAQTETGYSMAATAIARYFVERTEHATFADQQIKLDELAHYIGLSVEDTEDALYELSDYCKVTHGIVLAYGALFSKFDKYWSDWDPADDALKLAADIVNNSNFPVNPSEIAKRYGWEPRRLNPAIYYLLERKLIRDYKTMGAEHGPPSKLSQLIACAGL